MNIELYDISRPAIKVFAGDATAKSGTDKYLHFSTGKHEYLTDNHARSKYKKDTKSYQKKHFGQLKLFLTNIQFITKYWDVIKYPDPVLLYVGAAPCVWGLLFMKYFPSFELHLYDPSKFNDSLYIEAKKNKKLFLYNQLFEDADAEKWKNSEKDIFFVSDIRLRTYDKEGENAQKDVHECMLLQQDFVKKINPIFSQLKFKLPYEGFNCDNYNYFDGRIYFQPWVGPLSSEARLVTSRPHTSTTYICKQYEEMMFNHNIITRNNKITLFKNVLDPDCSKYQKLGKLGLSNNWDSSLTINIIKEYLEKVDIEANEDNVFNFFLTVSEAITTPKNS